MTRNGFCLESADSVRFGPEYSLHEKRRSQLVLFGEALCGLLLGEKLWTNAVFAFESQGLVSVMAAICRAFTAQTLPQTYVPFALSIYAGDFDQFQQKPNVPWNKPGEVLLRCYANRLHAVVGTSRPFQLSATARLDSDASRRQPSM